jgi:molybdate transport system regulatory protein
MTAALSVRIDFGPGQRLGPGKIQLLERIAELGSISAGGRALGMSYRRAWQLVDELNGIFGQPVLVSKIGGKQGGGAVLTPLGRVIIESYRDIERAAAKAAGSHVKLLNAQITK